MPGAYASVSGRIDYVTDGAGVRGHENFTLIRHDNGNRSLRAHCEMYDEQLLRDVYLCVDGQFRPSYAHLSLWAEAEFVGAGQYVFSDKEVTLNRFAGAGVQTQTQSLSSPALAFASHAVQNDAWLYPAVERSRTGHASIVLPSVPVSSKLPNGADGPAIILSDQTHRYVGKEIIETPAGRFETRHYEFCFSDRPSIHYWVHGEDFLLVRCRWDYLQQTYELTQLAAAH